MQDCASDGLVALSDNIQNKILGPAGAYSTIDFSSQISHSRNDKITSRCEPWDCSGNISENISSRRTLLKCSDCQISLPGRTPVDERAPGSCCNNSAVSVCRSGFPDGVYQLSNREHCQELSGGRQSGSWPEDVALHHVTSPEAVDDLLIISHVSSPEVRDDSLIPSHVTLLGHFQPCARQDLQEQRSGEACCRWSDSEGTCCSEYNTTETCFPEPHNRGTCFPQSKNREDCCSESDNRGTFPEPHNTDICCLGPHNRGQCCRYFNSKGTSFPERSDIGATSFLESNSRCQCCLLSDSVVTCFPPSDRGVASFPESHNRETYCLESHNSSPCCPPRSDSGCTCYRCDERHRISCIEPKEQPQSSLIFPCQSIHEHLGATLADTTSESQPDIRQPVPNSHPHNAAKNSLEENKSYSRNDLPILQASRNKVTQARSLNGATEQPVNIKKGRVVRSKIQGNVYLRNKTNSVSDSKKQNVEEKQNFAHVYHRNKQTSSHKRFLVCEQNSSEHRNGVVSSSNCRVRSRKTCKSVHASGQRSPGRSAGVSGKCQEEAADSGTCESTVEKRSTRSGTCESSGENRSTRSTSQRRHVVVRQNRSSFLRLRGQHLNDEEGTIVSPGVILRLGAFQENRHNFNSTKNPTHNKSALYRTNAGFTENASVHSLINKGASGIMSECVAILRSRGVARRPGEQKHAGLKRNHVTVTSRVDKPSNRCDEVEKFQEKKKDDDNICGMNTKLTPVGKQVKTHQISLTKRALPEKQSLLLDTDKELSSDVVKSRDSPSQNENAGKIPRSRQPINYTRKIRSSSALGTSSELVGSGSRATTTRQTIVKSTVPHKQPKTDHTSTATLVHVGTQREGKNQEVILLELHSLTSTSPGGCGITQSSLLHQDPKLQTDKNTTSEHPNMAAASTNTNNGLSKTSSSKSLSSSSLPVQQKSSIMSGVPPRKPNKSSSSASKERSELTKPASSSSSSSSTKLSSPQARSSVSTLSSSTSLTATTAKVSSLLEPRAQTRSPSLLPVLKRQNGVSNMDARILITDRVDSDLQNIPTGVPHIPGTNEDQIKKELEESREKNLSETDITFCAKNSNLEGHKGHENQKMPGRDQQKLIHVGEYDIQMRDREIELSLIDTDDGPGVQPVLSPDLSEVDLAPVSGVIKGMCASQGWIDRCKMSDEMHGKTQNVSPIDTELARRQDFDKLAAGSDLNEVTFDKCEVEEVRGRERSIPKKSSVKIRTKSEKNVKESENSVKKNAASSSPSSNQVKDVGRLLKNPTPGMKLQLTVTQKMGQSYTKTRKQPSSSDDQANRALPSQTKQSRTSNLKLTKPEVKLSRTKTGSQSCTQDNKTSHKHESPTDSGDELVIRPTTQTEPSSVPRSPSPINPACSMFMESAQVCSVDSVSLSSSTTSSSSLTQSARSETWVGAGMLPPSDRVDMKPNVRAKHLTGIKVNNVKRVASSNLTANFVVKRQPQTVRIKKIATENGKNDAAEQYKEQQEGKTRKIAGRIVPESGRNDAAEKHKEKQSRTTGKTVGNIVSMKEGTDMSEKHKEQQSKIATKIGGVKGGNYLSEKLKEQSHAGTTGKTVSMKEGNSLSQKHKEEKSKTVTKIAANIVGIKGGNVLEKLKQRDRRGVRETTQTMKPGTSRRKHDVFSGAMRQKGCSITMRKDTSDVDRENKMEIATDEMLLSKPGGLHNTACLALNSPPQRVALGSSPPQDGQDAENTLHKQHRVPRPPSAGLDQSADTNISDVDDDRCVLRSWSTDCNQLTDHFKGQSSSENNADLVPPNIHHYKADYKASNTPCYKADVPNSCTKDDLSDLPTSSTQDSAFMYHIPINENIPNPTLNKNCHIPHTRAKKPETCLVLGHESSETSSQAAEEVVCSKPHEFRKEVRHEGMADERSRAGRSFQESYLDYSLDSRMDESLYKTAVSSSVLQVSQHKDSYNLSADNNVHELSLHNDVGGEEDGNRGGTGEDDGESSWCSESSFQSATSDILLTPASRPASELARFEECETSPDRGGLDTLIVSDSGSTLSNCVADTSGSARERGEFHSAELFSVSSDVDATLSFGKLLTSTPRMSKHDRVPDMAWPSVSTDQLQDLRIPPTTTGQLQDLKISSTASDQMQDLKIGIIATDQLQNSGNRSAATRDESFRSLCSQSDTTPDQKLHLKDCITSLPTHNIDIKSFCVKADTDLTSARIINVSLASTDTSLLTTHNSNNTSPGRASTDTNLNSMKESKLIHLNQRPDFITEPEQARSNLVSEHETEAVVKHNHYHEPGSANRRTMTELCLDPKFSLDNPEVNECRSQGFSFHTGGHDIRASLFESGYSSDIKSPDVGSPVKEFENEQRFSVQTFPDRYASSTTSSLPDDDYSRVSDNKCSPQHSPHTTQPSWNQADIDQVYSRLELSIVTRSDGETIEYLNSETAIREKQTTSTAQECEVLGQKGGKCKELNIILVDQESELIKEPGNERKDLNIFLVQECESQGHGTGNESKDLNIFLAEGGYSRNIQHQLSPASGDKSELVDKTENPVNKVSSARAGTSCRSSESNTDERETQTTKLRNRQHETAISDQLSKHGRSLNNVSSVCAINQQQNNQVQRAAGSRNTSVNRECSVIAKTERFSQTRESYHSQNGTSKLRTDRFCPEYLAGIHTEASEYAMQVNWETEIRDKKFNVQPGDSSCFSAARICPAHPRQECMCVSAGALSSSVFMSSAPELGHHNISFIKSNTSRPFSLHETFATVQLSSLYPRDGDKVIQLSTGNSTTVSGKLKTDLTSSVGYDTTPENVGYDTTPDGFYDNGSDKCSGDRLSWNFLEFIDADSEHPGSVCEDVKTEKDVLICGDDDVDDYTRSQGDCFVNGFKDKVSGNVMVREFCEGYQKNVFKEKMSDHIFSSVSRDNSFMSGSENDLYGHGLFASRKLFLQLKPRAFSLSGPSSSSVSLLVARQLTENVLEQSINSKDGCLQVSPDCCVRETSFSLQGDISQANFTRSYLTPESQLFRNHASVKSIQEFNKNSSYEEDTGELSITENTRTSTTAQNDTAKLSVEMNYNLNTCHKNSQEKSKSIVAITEQEKKTVEQGEVTTTTDHEKSMTITDEGKVSCLRTEYVRESDIRSLYVNACTQDSNTRSLSPEGLSRTPMKLLHTPHSPRRLSPTSQSPRRLSPTSQSPKSQSPRTLSPRSQSPKTLSPTSQVDTLLKETSPFIMEKVCELLRKVSCSEQRYTSRNKILPSHKDTGRSTAVSASKGKTTSPTPSEKIKTLNERASLTQKTILTQRTGIVQNEKTALAPDEKTTLTPNERTTLSQNDKTKLSPSERTTHTPNERTTQTQNERTTFVQNDKTKLAKLSPSESTTQILSEKIPPTLTTEDAMSVITKKRTANNDENENISLVSKEDPPSNVKNEITSLVSEESTCASVQNKITSLVTEEWTPASVQNEFTPMAKEEGTPSIERAISMVTDERSKVIEARVIRKWKSFVGKSRSAAARELFTVKLARVDDRNLGVPSTSVSPTPRTYRWIRGIAGIWKKLYLDDESKEDTQMGEGKTTGENFCQHLLEQSYEGLLVTGACASESEVHRSAFLVSSSETHRPAPLAELDDMDLDSGVCSRRPTTRKLLETAPRSACNEDRENRACESRDDTDDERDCLVEDFHLSTRTEGGRDDVESASENVATNQDSSNFGSDDLKITENGVSEGNKTPVNKYLNNLVLNSFLTNTSKNYPLSDSDCDIVRTLKTTTAPNADIAELELGLNNSETERKSVDFCTVSEYHDRFTEPNPCDKVISLTEYHLHNENSLPAFDIQPSSVKMQPASNFQSLFDTQSPHDFQSVCYNTQSPSDNTKSSCDGIDQRQEPQHTTDITPQAHKISSAPSSRTVNSPQTDARESSAVSSNTSLLSHSVSSRVSTVSSLLRAHADDEAMTTVLVDSSCDENLQNVTNNVKKCNKHSSFTQKYSTKGNQTTAITEQGGIITEQGKITPNNVTRRTGLDEAKIADEQIPGDRAEKAETKAEILGKSVKRSDYIKSECILSQEKVKCAEHFQQTQKNKLQTRNSENVTTDESRNGIVAVTIFSEDKSITHLMEDNTHGSDLEVVPGSLETGDSMNTKKTENKLIGSRRGQKECQNEDRLKDFRTGEKECQNEDRLKNSRGAGENEGQKSRKYTWPTVAESLKRFQKSIAVSSPRETLQRGREEKCASPIRKDAPGIKSAGVEDKSKAAQKDGDQESVTPNNPFSVDKKVIKSTKVPDLLHSEVMIVDAAAVVPAVMLPCATTARPSTLNANQQSCHSDPDFSSSITRGSHTSWPVPSASERALPPSPIITLSPDAVASRDVQQRRDPSPDTNPTKTSERIPVVMEYKKPDVNSNIELSPLSDTDPTTPVPETVSPPAEKEARASSWHQLHNHMMCDESPVLSKPPPIILDSHLHGLSQDSRRNEAVQNRNSNTDSALETASAPTTATEEQTNTSSTRPGVRQHVPSTKLISVSIWDPSDGDMTLRSARKLWSSEDKHTLSEISETEEAHESHDHHTKKPNSSEPQAVSDECHDHVQSSRSPARPHTPQKRAPRRSLSLPSGGLSYGDVKILYQDGHFVMVDTAGQKLPKFSGETGSILEEVSEEADRSAPPPKLSSPGQDKTQAAADDEGSMQAEILSLLDTRTADSQGQIGSNISLNFNSWDSRVGARQSKEGKSINNWDTRVGARQSREGGSIFHSLPRRRGHNQRVAVGGDDVKMMKLYSKSQQSLLSRTEMERRKREEVRDGSSWLRRNNSFNEAMGYSVRLDNIDNRNVANTVSSDSQVDGLPGKQQKQTLEDSRSRKSRPKAPGFIQRMLQKRKGGSSEECSHKTDLCESTLSLPSVSSENTRHIPAATSDGRDSSVGRKISFREFFRRKNSADRRPPEDCSSPPIAAFLSTDDIGARDCPLSAQKLLSGSVGEAGGERELSPLLFRSRSPWTPISASSSQSSLFRSFSQDDTDSMSVAHQTDSGGGCGRRARSLSERAKYHGKSSPSEHFSGDSCSEFDLSSPDVYNSDGTLTPRSASPGPGDISMEVEQTLVASPTLSCSSSRLSPVEYRKLSASPQPGRRSMSVDERSKHSTVSSTSHSGGSGQVFSTSHRGSSGQVTSSSSDSGIQNDVRPNSSTESVQAAVKRGKSQTPSPRCERIKSDSTVRWADLLLGQTAAVRHRSGARELRKQLRPTSDTGEFHSSGAVHSVLAGASSLGNISLTAAAAVDVPGIVNTATCSSSSSTDLSLTAATVTTAGVPGTVGRGTCSSTDLRLLMRSRESLLNLVELRRPCRDAVSTRLAKLRRLSTPQPITVRTEKPKVKPCRSSLVPGVLALARSMPDNLDKLTRKRNYFSLIGTDAQSITSQLSVCEDSSDESDYSMDYHTEGSLSTRSSHVTLELIDQMLEEDSLTYAEALWDHVTMDPDELAFRAGDLIRVTEATDKHWWYGVLDHTEGWFPATFVRLRVNQDVMSEELTFLLSDGEAMIVSGSPDSGGASLSYMGKLQARTNVVNEIISAEREYVKHLQDVVEGYLKHTRKRPEMFPAEKVATIFSNIEQIYLFATDLLADLERSINNQQPYLSQIGHCFLDKVKEFEMYSDYCNNHSAASEELREMYRNKRYRHFFEACRLLQEMIEIPLEGFLLTPVQKICKYHLQLAELLRFTPPDHADYIHVKGALEAMKRIAMLINERKRKMESVEKLAAWQMLVDGWEGPDILTDSSELIYSGELNKINHAGWSQERYFFLFDHQMIYCKKDLLKKSSFCFKGRINMDRCQVLSLPDGRDSQYNVNVKNGWKLHDTDSDKWYLLVAKTSVAKQRWLKAFQDERKRVKDDTENNFYIPNHVKQAVITNFKQKTSRDHKPKGKGMFARANTAQVINSTNSVNAITTLPRTKKHHKIKTDRAHGKSKKISWFFFNKS